MAKHLQLLPMKQIEVSREDATKATRTIPSEIPAPPVTLSAREKKIWNSVGQAMLEHGMVHRVHALLLSAVTKGFVRWVQAEEILDRVIVENGGSYMVETPNGYVQPHQAFYAARTAKKDLLPWLAEAGLTVPSFMKAMNDMPVYKQGNLFGEDPDPVKAFIEKRRNAAMRSVP